jgi:hypothetical protein
MVYVLVAVLGGALIFLLALYQHGVKERNCLTYDAGFLLLADDVRAIHKKNFQTWIQNSSATDALTLSTGALRAIQGMATRLARPDPPAVSSVLGFNALVWNQMKEIQAASDTQG